MFAWRKQKIDTPSITVSRRVIMIGGADRRLPIIPRVERAHMRARTRR